jgi:hypothetical protein
MRMIRMRGRLPTIIAFGKKRNPDIRIKVVSSDPVNGYGNTHWSVFMDEEDMVVYPSVYGSQESIDAFERDNPLDGDECE